MRAPAPLFALMLSAPALAQAPAPDQVTMRLGDFLKLYEDTKNRPDKPEKAPRHFALADATYDGEVILEDDEPISAVFSARLRVDVLKKDGWVKVPLLPATVAVRDARIAGQPAPLVLEGGYYNLVTDRKDAFDVVVDFAVGVDTTQGSSGFNFRLVPSGATSVSLSVPSDEDLDFSVAGAKLVQDRAVGNRRILDATLPSTGSLAVRWQREIPEAEKEQDPRLYAEVYTLVGVGDGILRATTTVQETILFAGVDQLQARVPEGMTLLDVTGTGIRDWSMDEDNVLTVLLNYAAEGSYSMTLELEQVLGEGEQLSAFAPLVEPLGVERSKGFVGVQALGTLELTSGSVVGATSVDVRTLPASIVGVTSQPVLLGYKYLGGEVSIPFQVFSHDEVDVLVTLLDQTDATTMFTADGRRLTSVRYAVRNNRRQFLRLGLPDGAELWSASVAGKSVQPAKSGDEMLLPLVRSQAAGGNLAAFPVEVVYVEKGDPPADNGHGTFAGQLPLADVPSTYVAWTVYAPWDAKVKKRTFDGNLRHVEALSRPIDATTVMQVDAYNAPIQQAAGNQASSGALGSGAAPVQVSLPVEGQAIYFEKLLALEEELEVSFGYRGLKD